MKGPLPLLCLLILFTLLSHAQKPGGGGGRPVVPNRPRVDIPDPNANTSLSFVSGKVVVDDGSMVTDSAIIQTICRGKRRSETHTDSQGNFSFQFGSRSNTVSNPEYEVDSDSSSSMPGRRLDRRDPQDCELQASLAGFTSDVIQLGGRMSGSESVDIGRIVLHRLGNVQGFTISVTTAQAPEEARKALEKGQSQIKKTKWEDAQKSLEKAVAIYPKFALAWFELGQVQLQENNAVGAKASFQQSIAADSKYISPYHSLAQLALRDRNWRELTDFSEKLLSLNSANFPDFWLWNSLGNYCLRNLPEAEKSARRLALDIEHHVPRLEYLLGMVLLKKLDYQEAAQHLRAFLDLATQPAEKAEAQKQLSEIDRLTANAKPVPGDSQ